MDYNINKNIQIHYPRQQSLNNKATFANIFEDGSGQKKRYFSGIDAEIYFDDIYIDDVVRIDFGVEQLGSVIYGYNSYVYDALVLGARIINGEFEINFTKAAYLYEVLNSLNGGNSKIECNSEKSPMWNKKFDIYVSYGDARQTNSSNGSTILLLKNVSLLSSEQGIDASGRPVTERYKFVARDIEYITSETNGTSEDLSSAKKEESADSVAITSTAIRVVDSKDVYMDITISEKYDVTAIMYRISKDDSYEVSTFASGTKKVSILMTGSNSSNILKKFKADEYVNIYYILDYSDDTVASKREQTIKAHKTNA